MAEIVVSCAADPDFAKDLNDYLLSSLNSKKNSITLDGDEIYINEDRASASRKNIIKAIHSFLAKNKNYKDREIAEYGKIITVGIPSKPGRLMESLWTCEMCNYMTQYEEQLRLHKMTHGNVMIG